LPHIHIPDLKNFQLDIPKLPPVWAKPAAAVANTNQDITLNDFLAKSAPDYEAELCFITSRKCKNLTPTEAQSNILG
jgi:2-keto-4-pentenoate hydratase/2-oxohepta-3-ene-1,7-dioic acid hydratase in catechol pathway